MENGDDAADEDDDIDLFGSDEDDEETARIKQERLEAYAAKKSKKPALIAKSSILLDVKPVNTFCCLFGPHVEFCPRGFKQLSVRPQWDDETDMVKLEECVRSVQMDGLLWGASKLVPVGYGIKKLQINCVVEDDKVGTDILEEEVTKFEDFVSTTVVFDSRVRKWNRVVASLSAEVFPFPSPNRVEFFCAAHLAGKQQHQHRTNRISVSLYAPKEKPGL